MRPQGPTFWLLDGRTGWRTAHVSDVTVGDRSGIRLAANPLGPLSLRSKAGDLGGLTLPPGIAVDDSGIVYLLDQAEPWIKRFDPATLRFRKLPAVGGRGSEARQFQNPANIACAGRNLYVADRGNHRVQVFDIQTLALSHVWAETPAFARTRPGEMLDEPWDPCDVTARAGVAYILDRRYGRVYSHRPGTDRLRLVIDKPGAAERWTRVAVDRNGSAYLLDSTKKSEPCLDIYERRAKGDELGDDETCLESPRCPKDPVWQCTESVVDPGDVRDRFDPPPIRLDYEERFCLPARFIGSLRLREREIKDPGGLAIKLRHGKDLVSKYLYDRFSPEVQKLLEAYEPSSQPSDKLRTTLTEELNRQLRDAELYQDERFAQVELTSEIRRLICQNPRDKALVYLNRLLLEAAYPQKIAKGCLIWYGPEVVTTPPTLEDPLSLCPPSAPEGLIFDRAGKPARVDPAERLVTKLYEIGGTWYSEALDSKIYQCQWHRLELELDALPAGTQVIISTYTDERKLSLGDIDDDLWDTRYRFTGKMKSPPDSENEPLTETPHEILVQSREGRYLWLRIQLKGDGYATPAVTAVRAHYPRSSYLEYLPAVFAADDESRWFLERFLSIFQTPWDELEQQIEDIRRYSDPDAVPGGDALRYLAQWLALPLEGAWSEVQQRNLLAAAPDIYPRRGQVDGLRKYLAIYLRNIAGLEPEAKVGYPRIVEGFRERWFLQLAMDRQAELGHGALLWGPSMVGRLQLDVFAREGEVRLVSTGDPERDLFHEYAHRFRVFVPSIWVRSAEDERMLRRALDAEKPAHTKYDLCLVEPRFRVGFQSTVGLDTIIGAYPVARLACPHEADAPPSRPPRYRLGYDTILAGEPSEHGGVRLTPSTRIGIDTRLV